MSTDPDTKAYLARPTQQGKQKKFIMRCLKGTSHANSSNSCHNPSSR